MERFEEEQREVTKHARFLKQRADNSPGSLISGDGS